MARLRPRTPALFTERLIEETDDTNYYSSGKRYYPSWSKICLIWSLSSVVVFMWGKQQSHVPRTTNDDSAFLLPTATNKGVTRTREGYGKHMTTPKTGDPCFDQPMSTVGVPTFKYREELGDILAAENKTRGAELGVLQGGFSRTTLTKWSNCEEYHMVDLWAHQENYVDSFNVLNDVHDRHYKAALANTEKWKDIRKVCRNYTSECAKLIPDEYLDYVYVDARHDFKGAYEDMVNWWPKLKPGGIMAGHDYVTQDDGPTQTNQDWTTNYDGTKDETREVVKGAVDKFAREHCRQVAATYREPKWNTWALRK